MSVYLYMEAVWKFVLMSMSLSAATIYKRKSFYYLKSNYSIIIMCCKYYLLFIFFIHIKLINSSLWLSKQFARKYATLKNVCWFILAVGKHDVDVHIFDVVFFSQSTGTIYTLIETFLIHFNACLNSPLHGMCIWSK